MKISRAFKRPFHAAAFVAMIVFCASASAQSDRAETVFAEAKSLAATPETVERSFAKFDEAVSLFRAAKNEAKAAEVELEHGRTLRLAAVREMNADRHVEALAYFDRALPKFRVLNNRLEMAFVYHDLGYLAGRKGRTNDAVLFYGQAIENYRVVGEKSGEATVLRNLGVLRNEKGDREAALSLFQSALKLRIAMGDDVWAAQLYFDIGGIHETLARSDDALAQFNQSLELYRRAKDRAGQAAALYRIGSLKYRLYKFAESAQSFEAAMKLYEAEANYAAEADAAQSLGRALMAHEKNALAEPYFSRAADMFITLKDVSREAYALHDIAVNYQAMKRLVEARSALERSFVKFREAKDELGEAHALLTEADLLSYLNKHDEARKALGAAQKLITKHKDTRADYRLARGYASHWYSVSNHGEAIRYGMKAIEAADRMSDIYAKASAYVDLANSYSALGQREKSIQYTSEAMATARRVGSRYMESICLSNLGYEHFLLKKYSEAEQFFKGAIAIMNADGFEREEGYATHNLGLVYFARGDHTRALASYERAYALYRKVGDRRPQAFVLDSFGELYRDTGDHDKAVDFLQKAIVLAREIRYGEIEAQALGNMMTLWTRQRNPRLAALYGKQSVNIYQSIRALNRTAEKAAQKSFVQSNEKTYRQLANVLIEEGRLAEAQQVLDLLKAEEYFEFVRRDAAEADEHAALALNESERKALAEYSRVSDQLTSLGATFQTLQDKRNRSGGKLSETEEAEYVRLKSQVESAGEGLKTFLTKLAAEFSKKVEDGTVVTPQSIETLRADLRRAGPDVVLVSTYLLPERYRAIVTTGRTMVDRKVEYKSMKLTGADINRKIFEFQRALQNPGVDPRKLGKELYDIFVKPLENDLKGAGAKTILWSLDGSLRYVPMAALSPDGKTYLAERYQNVVVTLGRQTSLFVKPSADEWRAIGAGVSKQHAGFSALPSVPAEIGSIVRDEQTPTGVLDGTRMLDEQFNLEALRNTVPQQTDDGKPFNVLHLATHFSLGASDQDSALLLGDGTRLSLFDIGRDEALDFKDVELLTLSACQTGVSTGDANGREVESLGMLAQKKGAKAVLATLWKVADESTSLFMAEFYRIKKANASMNKAEAIRVTQKAMIDGRIKSSGRSGTCRAESFASGAKSDEFKCDPNAPFSHPYFWSPFVLIGNWR